MPIIRLSVASLAPGSPGPILPILPILPACIQAVQAPTGGVLIPLPSPGVPRAQNIHPLVIPGLH